jgi:lysophospholipid acyltransferase
MAEQLGDAFVQTPNALRVWLRQVVPPAPVNHSELVISSDAVKAYIAASPLGAALDADVNWVAAACADYAAAVARAAAPATVFSLPAGVAAAVDGLAAQLGQDGTGLRYLLALLVAYPLGAAFAAVPGRTAKNALSLALGLFLAQVVFPGGWAHSALSAGVAYALLVGAHGLRRLTGISAPARWAHVAVFAWMMGYMTAVHLYRLHTDYMGWSLDFSGPQMLLTIKLTALAFNMYDGMVMGDTYRKGIAEGHPLARIYRDRLARAVTAIPDPLSYAGYVYAFTSFFAGPAFEYAEYDRSVREMPFRDAATGRLGSRHWGSRLRAAGGKLAAGLIFLGLHMVGGAVFNFDGVLSADMLHGPGALRCG